MRGVRLVAGRGRRGAAESGEGSIQVLGRRLPSSPLLPKVYLLEGHPSPFSPANPFLPGVAEGEVGQGEIRGGRLQDSEDPRGFVAGEMPERASFAPCPTTNGHKVLGLSTGPIYFLRPCDRNQSCLS